MNPDLELLNPYPFERLADLLEGHPPPADRRLLKLSIGEPQHAPPEIVVKALTDNLDLLAKYPTTRGTQALRESQAQWLCNRHSLRTVDPDSQVLPVNGTREALFAIAQTCVGHQQNALVGSPNPFYQIYEGAALLAGGQSILLNTDESTGFLPDPEALSVREWDAMRLLYLCSPSNPTGAVMDSPLLQRFIQKAIEHDVVLVSDECYSEIYPDENAAPTGLLAACADMGHDSYKNCISMHSLSKRSNLPGMRSGFAAGDADIIAQFLRYRGYHGSAMPPHHQVASTVAWSDEEHVLENRDRYREKFSAVRHILDPVLELNNPAGAFYLWPRVPIDDATFAQRLHAEAGVLVLPGSYLSHDNGGVNPGKGRVRMALVAELEDCIEAAERIAGFVRCL
ncbi:succinyldiaminopimelate transaminase [Congregibacter brevis]|uniref:Succinyldiaminopimelate transaminase n=1 Tax=Congregibacter brevis TaxID=3081201 RepID=A0ABZ0IA47_9GAMM|nr:succinyldiaminopimelate transaminase [Congregibacter sp. IMCC45268]